MRNYVVRSHSRSPSRKYQSSHISSSKKLKAPSPPSPPRIRRSPQPSSSHKKRSHDQSPSLNGKYSLSPVRMSKHRLDTPSPPPHSSLSSFKYNRNKSPISPKFKTSPQHSPRRRYRQQSPDGSSKKHRHKHKY